MLTADVRVTKRVALTAVLRGSRESRMWERRCVLAAYTLCARAPARCCPPNEGEVMMPRSGHISRLEPFAKQQSIGQSLNASMPQVLSRCRVGSHSSFLISYAKKRYVVVLTTGTVPWRVRYRQTSVVRARRRFTTRQPKHQHCQSPHPPTFPMQLYELGVAMKRALDGVEL